MPNPSLVNKILAIFKMTFKGDTTETLISFLIEGRHRKPVEKILSL